MEWVSQIQKYVFIDERTYSDMSGGGDRKEIDGRILTYNTGEDWLSYSSNCP
jgi:hypothetical protein